MEFVDKDLALKLKEKGFNKLCFGYYHLETPTEFVDGELALNNYSCNKETPERDIDFQPNVIGAPTIEQTLKWLREEKKIYVGISYVPKVNDNMDFYYPNVQKIGDIEPMLFPNDTEIFDSYEDACIAGIEYVINNLI